MNYHLLYAFGLFLSAVGYVLQMRENRKLKVQLRRTQEALVLVLLANTDIKPLAETLRDQTSPTH